MLQQRQNKTRVAGIIIAAILIVFAFLAILNTNLLAWPLASELGESTKTNANSGPPLGELVLTASILQSGGFMLNGSSVSELPMSAGPLQGASAQVFFSSSRAAQNLPIVSNITNNLGELSIKLAQGTYLLQVNTGFSILSSQIVIVSNNVTYFKVNVTESQHMASFFDLTDSHFIGQVLPSENVFLEFNNSLQEVNSSGTHFLQTYYYMPQDLNSTPLGTIANYFLSQSQQVQATILSGGSSNNGSLWVTVEPQSPLSTSNVRYVALANVNTTFSITNKANTGAP